ncbi:Phytochrome-like protein cph2 [Saliniradius amylolyticus]|uniref:diguanylate cyclase n=1 Tax=Saliniradius amylolyticus TaxID=2183582 RepID=A0A2S2E1Z7_9ALTE|nr:sensor domain-containing diguanylate cyclase [Saliniradius amylolyticus]AWL11047.1 Phytochrome-like protein cph2 [Saliniradius amylolyticus]
MNDSLSSLALDSALLSKLEVGVVVLDLDYRVLVWNDFMMHHSGVQAQSIIGQSLFERFDEIDPDWFRRKTEPVFRLKTPTYVIAEQRPYLFKFNSYRPVTGASVTMFQNITLFPLTDDKGKVTQVGVLVYDVTEEVTSRQQLAQANERLESISRIDGLTGLYNRRYWEECCELEFKRQQRYGGDTSLVMLDIDHFKQINDTYGHPAGDQVIKALAKIIQTHCRETDMAGRYGGEEFVLLLPDTPAACAQTVAERIRLEAEQMVVQYDGQGLRFTSSFGVSGLGHEVQSFMQWVEQADKALYLAKEQGRNRVCMA